MAGIDRIDQPAEGVEGVPGDADDRGDRGAAQHGAAERAQAIDEEGDEGAEHEDVEELGGGGEIGPLQEGALQDLLDGLGVERDAGDRGFERRRSQIEQARRARADDQNAALDVVGADLAIEHFPGRQIAILGLSG